MCTHLCRRLEFFWPLNIYKTTKKAKPTSCSKNLSINHTTLFYPYTSKSAYCDTEPNSKKLTELEEENLVQYMVEIATQSLPSKLHDVEDMANQLLHA